MMLTIADTLPKEMTGILSCCEPVPPLVHQNLGDIHRIILQARDLPLHEVRLASISFDSILFSGLFLGLVFSFNLLLNYLQDKVERSGPDKRKKQKDWMVLLNSIHDVSIEPSKVHDDDDEAQSWPEHWNPPVAWSELVVKTSCSIPFGRAAVGMNGLTKVRENSRAYGRYELSNNILDILRNPTKKGSLDMSDPVVRAVQETLLVDPLESDKPLCASSQPKVEPTGGLDRVLPEKDFVAFNPMVKLSSLRVSQSSQGS